MRIGIAEAQRLLVLSREIGPREDQRELRAPCQARKLVAACE
jgi:hypothetical protein